MNNPAVTGDLRVRFYVGQPLFVEGQPIGTLCLLDPKSRKIKDVELINLKDLATLAEGYISMRAQSAQIAELRQVLSGEQRRAMLDPLTQTWNRLGLQRLVEAWRVNADGKFSIGIAYCDLDHFKSINDRYGHPLVTKCCVARPSHLLRQCEMETSSAG
jgi:GAF domain-containing protein